MTCKDALMSRTQDAQERPRKGTIDSGLPALRPAGQPNGCSNLFQTDLSLRFIITE